MNTPSSSSDEAVFLIDLATGTVDAIPEITLQSIGLKERSDLQRWITEHPEIVGRDLLLVTTEFDQWEIRDQKVADRLDVLFLDTDGSPVVAELKRGVAADTTDLQALKYAAYCSQLTVDDLVEQYSRHHKVDLDAARAAVEDHAPSIAEGELAAIRIRLVAGGFGPSVTTVVLWLRDHDIDIGCIQVTARRHDNGTAILAARQLLPLPEAEDYLVRRRRKEQEEEARKSTRRALNSVTLLDQAGVTHPGDKLQLKVSQFTAEQRPKIEPLVASDPSIAEAEWTGLGVQKALRWAHDGKEYSCTGLVKAILQRVGIHLEAIPGPDYWLLPTGRSVYEESKLAEVQMNGIAEDGA